MGTVSIHGLGEVQLSRAEYTHPDIASQYNQLLAILTEIYGRRPSQTGADPKDEFSDTDFLAIVDAIQSLKNLATNGLQRNIVFGNSSSPIGTFYLTTRMANSLDMVLRSLEAAGITDPPLLTDPQEQKNAVIRWIDLAGFGVAELLSSAVSAGLNNRSLQSLIELEYVKVGNEIIFQGLTTLEEALRNTQKVIETLNELQTIRNLVGVNTPQSFRSWAIQANPAIYGPLFGNITVSVHRSTWILSQNWFRMAGLSNEQVLTAGQFTIQQWIQEATNYLPFGLSNTILVSGPFYQPGHENGASTLQFNAYGDGDFMKFYKEAMSRYIKTVVPTVGGTQSLIFQIFGIRSRLQTHLEEISRLTPGQGRETQGTLAFNLDQLLKNISAIFSTTTTMTDETVLMQKVRDFILVNQGEQQGVSSALKAKNIALQTSINTAITSAESLNDRQKQEVRRFLFIFEEFYKSASAVLTKISQLIEKFAQGAAK